MSTRTARRSATDSRKPGFLPPGGRPRLSPALCRPQPARRATAFVSLALGALWTGLMLVHLFAGGPIGLADQQDGNRLVCQLGVGNDRPWASDTTGYVYTRWIPYRMPGEACGAAGSGEPYPSSQLLPLWLAKQLTPVLGMGDGLDLKALGVVHAVAVGVLLGLLCAVLTGRLWVRAAFVCAVGLVMCDSLFAGFFVSPYSEPGGLLGILALCVAVLHLARKGCATWGALLALTAAALWTTMAKTQLMVFLPLIMAVMLWLPGPGPAEAPASDAAADERPSRTARLGAALRRRVPALLLCGVLGMCALWFTAEQPKRLNDMVWYDAVFMEMLPHSKDPEAKLKALGADPSLVDAANTNIISPDSAARSPHWEDYRKKVTPLKIVLAQLTDPASLLDKQRRGLVGVVSLQLDFLGSYPPDSGHPEHAKEHRWPLGGWLFKALGNVLIVIPLGGLLMGAMGAVVATRRHLPTADRGLGVLALLLAGGCIGQFWMQMLTMGQSDLNKHLIFIGFMMMLGIPVFAAMCGALARARRS
ncbi:hypothetical protein ACFY2W_18390 [Streptomyces sp. NPDC001262]|uniref:glycan biosynthesis hexose transferase WsfD n=1 Tax=unclassified Streptomyces TaxID=2593676 RepID=UPI0036B66F54